MCEGIHQYKWLLSSCWLFFFSFFSSLSPFLPSSILPPSFLTPAPSHLSTLSPSYSPLGYKQGIYGRIYGRIYEPSPGVSVQIRTSLLVCTCFTLIPSTDCVAALRADLMVYARYCVRHMIFDMLTCTHPWPGLLGAEPVL